MTKSPQEVIAHATASGLLDGIQSTQQIKKEGHGRKTRKAYQSRRQPHVSINSQSQVAKFLNREAKLNSSAPAAALERTNDTVSPWGNTRFRTSTLRLSFHDGTVSEVFPCCIFMLCCLIVSHLHLSSSGVTVNE